MDNNQIVKDLQPTEVFKYFGEICSIPHGSGNVKKISDYCVEFAKKNNLWVKQDEYGNVIIKKAASKGYEDRPGVIIQGHLDMVAVKENDCNKNMAEDGLDLEVDGDYLYAKGTSLGADDGIAVAYALAILASDNIEHPAIEAVFTVDEEIGLLGASAMDLSDIEGKIMLNIDSEEEDKFVVGCAGGATVECVIPVERKKKSGTLIEVSICNLCGGHSGVEIICQRANANVLAGRLLYNLSTEINMNIVTVSGGEKDNAIAKDAVVKILADEDDVNDAISVIEQFKKAVKSEFSVTDPDLTVDIKVSEKETAEVIKKSSGKNVITALINNPNGIMKMSNDIKGLVQTSLNLGKLTDKDDSISLSYSVRSSVATEKVHLINMLQNLTNVLGGRCTIFGAYPGWEYRKNSKLRDCMVGAYKKLKGSEPVVETIHAGLECGIISEKIDDLDCISFGPDIIDIHTTKEKLSISSAKRTWELILEVLKIIN